MHQSDKLSRDLRKYQIKQISREKRVEYQVYVYVYVKEGIKKNLSWWCISHADIISRLYEDNDEDQYPEQDFVGHLSIYQKQCEEEDDDERISLLSVFISPKNKVKMKQKASGWWCGCKMRRNKFFMIMLIQLI